MPELVDRINETPNITLLAPNNEALIIAMAGSSDLQTNADLLSSLLLYHVLSGLYPLGPSSRELDFVPTLLVKPAPFVKVTGGQVVAVNNTLGNVTIAGGLLQTSNVVAAVSDKSLSSNNMDNY